MQINLNTPNFFEIIVGTYEQYLLGYKFTNIVNEYKLEKSFATHSHLGSIRSVASNNYYLASAGADETICLYDLRNRIESGKLMHHNDTVNHVTFTPEASHLFSCSKDGTIAAVRCGNWQMQKHWMKPHKGLSVHTLAIHPTGKLALSTGADGILRTWNLVKGRQAYATNLVPRLKSDAKDIIVLKWSPNGEKYLLAANQLIDIFSVQLAGIDQEVQLNSKVVCVEFLKDDLIVIGLENGHIKFYDLEKLAYTLNILAHDIRIKCMAYKDDLLVTASSNGEIKLWRFTRNKVDMLQSINCGARITCLTLAALYQNVVYKKETDFKVEEKVKNKNKFRLQQEVIIEDDNDDANNDNDDDNDDDSDDDDDDHWEVTSIDNSNINLSTTSKNNSTSAEWIEADANSSGKLNTNGQLSKNNQRNKRSIDSVENFSPSPKKKTLNEDRNNNSNSNSNSNKKKKDIHIKKRKIEETEQNVTKTSFKKRKKTIKTETESDTKVQKNKKQNWLEERSKKVSKKIEEEKRPVPSKNITKKDTESVKKREKWKTESLKVEEKNKKVSKKRKTIEDGHLVSSNKMKKKKQ